MTHTPDPARQRFHAIVPAAGRGSRMGGERPKQYLPLLGRPVIAHTLETLLAVPELDAVWVVLAPDDPDWDSAQLQRSPRLGALRVGGERRADTVSNALAALTGKLCADDWVLVHDAARACLDAADVSRMIGMLRHDAVGGLLACPVADTLKRGDASMRVAATEPREGLWQAQTPQMFRFATLRQALSAHPEVTDEAGAIEAIGLRPQLVPAPASNFKITYPADLALAADILAARKERTR